MSNPFPGLRPFEEKEAALFFGRERDITELLGRVMRQHFLAVLGSSGCGKSSVIKAGLIPSLKYETMDTGETAWRVASLRPGSNPIKQLALALTSVDALGDAQGQNDAAVPVMQTILRRGPCAIAEVVRDAKLPPEAKLLILVDQFEELFRFSERAEKAGASNDARAFINLLMTAASQRDCPIYVILTMRSEFLGQCAAFPGLAEAITNGIYLLPDMTRDQLRDVIQQPVVAQKGSISERLINRLLNDLGGSSDQLPILQHALMRLWTEWTAKTGEPIDLPQYQVVGELKGSLSSHAETIYEKELRTERKQKLAETLFRNITETTPEGQTVRKPTKLGIICRRAGASADEMKEVVETFREDGRSFLMPPKGVPLDDDTRIDISHESLIRQWTRLTRWAEVEAKESKLYKNLKTDSISWKENGRNQEWLYTGSRLIDAQQWAAKHPHLLDDDLAREFLTNCTEKEKYAGLLLRAGKWDSEGRDDSLLLRGKELGEAERWLVQAATSTDLGRVLLKKEVKDLVTASRRAVQRLTWYKATVAVLVVIALLVAFYAEQNKREAVAQKTDAEEKKTEAENARGRAEAYLVQVKELTNQLGVGGEEGRQQQSLDAGVQIKQLADLVRGRQTIQIRYFHEPSDGTRVLDALRTVGYNVRPQSKVVKVRTNAIWWGEGIKIDDIQFIAYTLIQNGFGIQYIGRSENFRNQIQIGGRAESLKLSMWTVKKVRALRALPVDNEATSLLAN